MRSRKLGATFLILSFVIVSLFQACGYIGGPESQMLSLSSASVDFASLRSNLLSPKCMACHSGASAAGGYDLSNYAGVMSGGRVIPYDPAGSLLIQRMRDGSMPPGQPLSDAEIRGVEEWILSGAPAFETLPPAAPTVDAGADQSLMLPAVNYSIFGGASDSDGTIVSYQWQKMSGPSVTLNGANMATLTLTNISSGTYVFKLTATDNDGLSNSDSVQVLVYPAAAPTPTPTPAPTATPTPTATPRATVTPTPTPTPAPTATPNPNAKYSWIYQNIIGPKCLNCHGVSYKAGVDLRTYTSTMRTVVQFNSASSQLFQSVNTGGMPIGSTKLTTEQLNAIKNWIDAGALNN